MSDPRTANRKSRNAGPVIPRGHVLGEFRDYASASEMVNKLVQNDFPAPKISIVGYDPVLVEKVRSKLGYGRVALSGSLTGFWLGLLFALLLGIGFTQTDEGALGYQPQQFAAVLILAAGAGMLLNILRFALAKNKRNFLSASLPVATRYEVLVPDQDAAEALKALNSKSD